MEVTYHREPVVLDVPLEHNLQEAGCEGINSCWPAGNQETSDFVDSLHLRLDTFLIS